MNLSASLKENGRFRKISVNVPVLQNPLIPVPLVDHKWARPHVFHDFSRYPFCQAQEVQNDFSNLVGNVNRSSKIHKLDRYKDGLLKTVENHIGRCGRILFCDLLMYVDCLAYLCFAVDLMSEAQINRIYASWVKYIVDMKRNYIMSSTRWGPTNYNGSDNEQDLNSCFN